MYKNCFTKAEISQIVSNASLTVDFWKDVYTAIQGIDTTPVNPMEEAVHLALKDFGIDITSLIIAHLHKPLSLLSNLFRFIPLSKNKSLLKKIDVLPPALIGRAKIYIEKLNELHFEDLSIEKETPSNPKNA